MDEQTYDPLLLVPPAWQWRDFAAHRQKLVESGIHERARSALSRPAEPTLDRITLDALRRWARLSVKARTAIAARPTPMTADECRARGHLDALGFTVFMDELEREGFGRRLRTAFDRLEVLTVKETIALADALKVSSKGNRHAIVARLRKMATEQSVAAGLPQRAGGEPGVAIDGFPPEARPWVDFQSAKILLLQRAAWAETRQARDALRLTADAPPAQQGHDLPPLSRAWAYGRRDPSDVETLLLVADRLFPGRRYSTLSADETRMVEDDARAVLASRQRLGGHA